MAENSKEPCWYVVHTYSGYENKVKDNIEKSVENNPEMQRLIFDVRVPVEDVVEIKGNKRVKSQRKVYPGYVLVHMIETSESWYLVRNTRGVTGFVGAGNKPTPPFGNGLCLAVRAAHGNARGHTARRHGAHLERPVREFFRPRGLDQRADADRQRHGADVQAGDAGRARFRRGRARGVRRLCPGRHARGAQC